MACCVLQLEERTQVKKQPFVGNHRCERRQASSPERRDYRQIVFAGTVRKLSLLGSLGWAGAAPKPHAGSSDDTVIELLSEIMTWLELVWLGRQRGMENFFFATASIVFEALQTV